MDPKLIYAKTPTGDEAVRQRTRVVQRNLRMVLIMVDGKLTVEELAAKVANPQMVESALMDLEDGGFIAPAGPMAANAWIRATEEASVFPHSEAPMSAMSRFEPLSAVTPASGFSGFVDPTVKPVTVRSGPTLVEKLRNWFVKLEIKSTPKTQETKPKLSFPVQKALAGGVLALILIAIGGVFLYPYNHLKPDIEASAARLLKAPVSIGDVSLGILPKPHIKLVSVTVGSQSSAVSLGEIRIFSPLAMWLGGSHSLSRVDVLGLKATPAGLLALPLSGGAVLANDGSVVRQVRLEQSSLTFGNDLVLSGVKGEMNFSEQGTLSKAVFENSDRTLLLEAEPLPKENVLRFALEGRAWRPGNLPISFDSMQARGLLMTNRLAIQNIDTTFLGGVLKGNWLLDWSANSFAMAGEGALTRLSSVKVSAALMPNLKLEGDLAGQVRMRSSAKDWTSLWNNVEGTLDAEITRGILGGVDLGEAGRRGQGASVRGGATKFDRLRVTVALKPKQLLGQNIQLDSGMLTASGQFSSDRENHVEALLNVNVQSSVANRLFPMQVAGQLPDLKVVVTK